MTKLSAKLTNGKNSTIVGSMAQEIHTFGELFKKYRLRSEFSTLSSFGNALANKGYVYEDSIYSHWQKNVRIPKERKLLLTIIQIFIERGGITSLQDANNFLNATGQGYLTHEEENSVGSNPSLQKSSIPPANLFAFLLKTTQAKRLIRTGWKQHGVRNPESVAEHSYQLCVMAMMLADQLGCDREKLTKMAIIHDLAEVITGDIVSEHGNMIDLKVRQKKEVLEAQGIALLFTPLDIKNEYVSIFEEMLQRKSHESDIFWQLDKLEMAIQALLYEQSDKKDLSEFFINTDLQLTHPYLREIFSHVQKARPKKK